MEKWTHFSLEGDQGTAIVVHIFSATWDNFVEQAHHRNPLPSIQWISNEN